MEGWGKIGVQSASVLYPNSCYNEPCYSEVQVYMVKLIVNLISFFTYSFLHVKIHCFYIAVIIENEDLHRVYC